MRFSLSCRGANIVSASSMPSRVQYGSVRAPWAEHIQTTTAEGLGFRRRDVIERFGLDDEM
jgi:hypothetical protein